MTLRLVELFAGIGSQAMALRQLGIPYTSTVCEIDAKAYASYCAIHGDTPNLGDITEVEHLPNCDLLTYSFPCQDLSIAGRQKGMERGSGTRSSLLWEVGRLLDDSRERGALPEVLLMENVDAILNRKNLPAFMEWVAKLRAMGYTNSWQVMNAKDYGVPQSRKRCFMVSTLHMGRFGFPPGIPLTRCLRDVLEDDVDESFYLSEERIAKYQRHKERHVAQGHGLGRPPSQPGGTAPSVLTSPQKGDTLTVVEGNINYAGRLNRTSYVSDDTVFSDAGISPTLCAHRLDGGHPPQIEIVGDLGTGYDQNDRVYGVDGIAPTTTAGGGHIARIEVEETVAWPAATLRGYMDAREGDGLVMNRLQTARGTVQDQKAPTLTTGDGCGTGAVVGRLRIRYLTPRECWRLMGFPDWAFDRARDVPTAKTQLYKQAGNSIVVDVLMAIFRGIYIDRTFSEVTHRQSSLEAFA